MSQTFTLQLLSDGRNSTSVEQNGTFGSLDGTPNKSLQPTTIVAIATAEGPMAFAIYYAPTDFARPGLGDEVLFARSISVTVNSPTTPGYGNYFSMSIMRPPVFLVHGLWGAPANWDNLVPLFQDYNLRTYRADYSKPVSLVTARNPDYQGVRLVGGLSSVRQNQLGLDYNSPGIILQIQNAIGEFSNLYDVAAVRVDVVAHSMGGLMTRNLESFEDYRGADSYRQGLVHKLITIGTPHLGTPIASDLLPGAQGDPNPCVRNLLARFRSVSYSNVTIDGEIFTGAVGDLRGDGEGGGLSPALARLRAASPRDVPTSLIGGVMTRDNLVGLDCTFCAASAIRTCSDPLARDLTSTRWPTVFQSKDDPTPPQSDAIVPRSSQFANLNGFPVSGLVHSAGVASGLSFNGTDELSSKDVAARVVYLLYSLSTGAEFTQRP